MSEWQPIETAPKIDRYRKTRFYWKQRRQGDRSTFTHLKPTLPPKGWRPSL